MSTKMVETSLPVITLLFLASPVIYIDSSSTELLKAWFSLNENVIFDSLICAYCLGSAPEQQVCVIVKLTCAFLSLRKHAPTIYFAVCLRSCIFVPCYPMQSDLVIMPNWPETLDFIFYNIQSIFKNPGKVYRQSFILALMSVSSGGSIYSMKHLHCS